MRAVTTVSVATYSSPVQVAYTGEFATAPPVGERSNVMNVSVCLSVCPCVREHISGTTCLNYTEFPMHTARGRGSVLFWRRCNTLRTSGFVDDVKFSNNGLCGTGDARM